MTDHPCKGMTVAQLEAFERIAINAEPGCTWPTIDALMEKGVIARGDGETRRDAMGPYVIPHFYVPVHVHQQWCQWCSEKQVPKSKTR